MLNWLLRFFSVPVIKKVVGSVVRTTLAALAGFLAAKGVPQELVGPIQDAIPAAQELVVGIAVAVYSLVQIWSIREKATR